MSVWMCVCRYVCLCMCMYVCMDVCMYVCVFMYVYVCLHVSICLYVCLYVCMSTDYLYWKQLNIMIFLTVVYFSRDHVVSMRDPVVV